MFIIGVKIFVYEKKILRKNADDSVGAVCGDDNGGNR
jgi:hypothetical protein